MAQNLDMSAYSAALKEYYPQNKIESMVYKNNPLLAMLRKDTKIEGESFRVPIRVGNPQGRGTTVAKAQQNAYASNLKAFSVTTADDYQVARISGKVLEASKTNAGAFIKALKSEMDAAIENITNSLAGGLYRSGTGTIGKIAVITSGVITLEDPESVSQFDVGQTLQAMQTDEDNGVLEAGTGYVVAVNRAAGTVTVSATAHGGNPGTPSGWTAGDYLLINGDQGAKIKGLDAWFPVTAPGSSDSFFGVNRSVDPTRLAGIRFDGSTMSIEEAFTGFLALAGREGATPNVCFTNFTSWGALQNSLGSKVKYETLKAGELVFESIRINGPRGPVDVIADRNCPQKRAYFLDMDTLYLGSMGAAPHIDEVDGLTVIRQPSDDGVEARIKYYAQLACEAPGRNGVVVLGA